MATRKKNKSSRNAHAINKSPTPEKRPRKLKGREAIAEERFRELVACTRSRGWTKPRHVNALGTKCATTLSKTDFREPFLGRAWVQLNC
jgi:hypothetical protein